MYSISSPLLDKLSLTQLPNIIDNPHRRPCEGTDMLEILDDLTSLDFPNVLDNLDWNTGDAAV